MCKNSRKSATKNYFSLKATICLPGEKATGKIQLSKCRKSTGSSKKTQLMSSSIFLKSILFFMRCNKRKTKSKRQISTADTAWNISMTTVAVCLKSKTEIASSNNSKIMVLMLLSKNFYCTIWNSAKLSIFIKRKFMNEQNMTLKIWRLE